MNLDIKKVCTKCNELKPLEDFSKASHHKHGRGSWCIRCKNKRSREIYAEDKKHGRKFRESWRKQNPGYHLRQYWPGLSAKQAYDSYLKLLNHQNGVCAICLRPEKHRHALSKEIRKLSVDHCHITGEVRGLLCSECNRAIGAFKDDASLFSKAAEYLKK